MKRRGLSRRCNVAGIDVEPDAPHGGDALSDRKGIYMSEPEWENAANHEIPRRSDVNPFRDYPAGPSMSATNAGDQQVPNQSPSGPQQSPLQHVRKLMTRRTEFVNAYNTPGISEEVRQTLNAEIMKIDRALEAAHQRQESQRAGLVEAGRGLGCLVLAGMVSLIGYFAADPGQPYYLFWGGMAVGALLLTHGLWRALNGSGRKWMIFIVGTAIIGFVWLNPMDWYGSLTEVRDPMRGTITISSTSCTPTQEVQITSLNIDGQRAGTMVSIPITDDGPVPLFNSGCTITFQTEVARAHAYEIAVPGVGERIVYYASIDGPSGPTLRVTISL